MVIQSDAISTNLKTRANANGFELSGEILNYSFNSALNIQQKKFTLSLPEMKVLFENGIFTNTLEIDQIKQNLVFDSNSFILKIENNQLGSMKISPRDIYGLFESFINGVSYEKFAKSAVSDTFLTIQSNLFSLEVTPEPKFLYTDANNHLLVVFPEEILNVDAQFGSDVCRLRLNGKNMPVSGEFSGSGVISGANFDFSINSPDS